MVYSPPEKFSYLTKVARPPLSTNEKVVRFPKLDRRSRRTGDFLVFLPDGARAFSGGGDRPLVAMCVSDASLLVLVPEKWPLPGSCSRRPENRSPEESKDSPGAEWNASQTVMAWRCRYDD